MNKITKINLMLLLVNISMLLIAIIININSNKEYDIWKEKKDCVYEVHLYDDGNINAYATCFVINKEGLLMTNKHVANVDDVDIYIIINGEKHKANVEHSSESYDLAILSVNYKFTKELNIIDYNSNVGDIVYTIGNPNGIGLLLQKGIVSGEKKNLIIEGGNYLVIQTSLALNEGNSGGPLFDENGNVIGIISFRMRDKKGDVLDSISFCYSSDEILFCVNEFYNIKF